MRALAERLGLAATVAHVEGDDLLAPRPGSSCGLGDCALLTANAYLGAWGIVDCLNAGADVVVTGRVTDASVIVGPGRRALRLGPRRLRPARRRGGGRATSSNAARRPPAATTPSSPRSPTSAHAGFPLAEIYDDGSSVITKHPGTGGQVSVGTVTAQLLYEISGARYANPDVTAAVRHHRAVATTAPTGCGSAGCAANRRRRR